MKIKFGAIVVDGSGKIGGHVASKNRAGAYLRTKVTPTNPNTTAQSNARALLSSLSTQWADLTPAQRQSFNDAVSSYATTNIFGDLKNPSGFNLFVKLNANLGNTFQPQVLTAPEKIEIPYSQLNSADGDVSASTFQLVLNSDDLDGLYVLVSATPPLSQGITNVSSKMRGLGATTVSTSTIDIYDMYVAKFGVPSAGDNIVVGFEVVVSTGQKSTKQTVKAVIVA